MLGLAEAVLYEKARAGPNKVRLPMVSYGGVLRVQVQVWLHA
jgi:hypothetical protein